MIDETMERIRARLNGAEALDSAKREELNKLLATLEAEVKDLARTRADHAESIAGFARASAHEATRIEKNPNLLRLATRGLAASVEGFETSHPRLVEVVNSICGTLASIGL